MPYLNEQLQIIKFLQYIRGPFVDGILKGLNFLDTEYFISVLIAFIWIGISWRWGIRLGFLTIASGWVNALCKVGFALFRPYYYDPTLAVIRLNDFGFPSGGAQSAVLFGGLLVIFWKNRWSWVVAVLYFVILSLSRILLGVHFPLDIIGGWAIGAVLLLLFVVLYRPIERLTTQYPVHALLTVIAGAILLGTFHFDRKIAFLMSSCIAISLGIYFASRLNLYHSLPPRGWWRSFLAFFAIIIAAGLAGLIRWLVPSGLMADALQAALGGLWISFLFCLGLVKK